MSDSNGEFLISLEEAGRMLGGISEKTVRRRIAEGLLPKPVRKENFLAYLVQRLRRDRKTDTGTRPKVWST